MTISVLLLFAVGLALISFGANMLVSSTEKISEKYNISYFLSSFIFIGLATSSPEIVISIISSLDGKSNIAIGNALGSNIANIALVLALSYLLLKKDDSSTNKTIDKETYGFIFFLIIIGIVLIPLLSDGVFIFNEAILLILVFLTLIFLYKKFFYQQNNDRKKNITTNYISGLKIIFTLLFGLSILLLGTEIFLNSSISMAKYFRISDYIIGLSITAIGTSIPELASSIESVRKKNVDFIIGNILGSNIFNFTIVIGAAGLLSYTQEPLFIKDLIRDMIMILITMMGFYTIIKNYNYLITKITCLLLLLLFMVYQITLYEIGI
tara:strand:- start:866 stop:1837 length:972 start_codon:yes stop_codon:yes gene_type:complete